MKFLKAILAKHPELKQISEALKEYRENRPITTRCAKCNKILLVTEIAATGSLWINCDNGCTNYHSKKKIEIRGLSSTNPHHVA